MVIYYYKYGGWLQEVKIAKTYFIVMISLLLCQNNPIPKEDTLLKIILKVCSFFSPPG